jgi:hypothetical protein
MHWNYRIVIKDGALGIHEVYYDDQGQPSSLSEDSVVPVASSVEELRDVLERLRRATQEPPLVYDDVADDPGRRPRGA